jgi:hypothetical protein
LGLPCYYNTDYVSLQYDYFPARWPFLCYNGTRQPTGMEEINSWNTAKRNLIFWTARNADTIFCTA